MLKDTERLKVALRVITAITDYCEPEEADVEALRSYVVVFMDKPSDELAREVIEQVLRSRDPISART